MEEEDLKAYSSAAGRNPAAATPPRSRMVLRKTLVVMLERIEEVRQEESQCVVCSQPFKPFKTKKGSRRPTVSGDLRFVVEKCLEGTWGSINKASFSPAVLVKLLCPTHIEVLAEGLRLQEQLKVLEETLQKLKTGVRQVVIKSLAAEQSEQTQKHFNKDKGYWELRKIFRNVISPDLSGAEDFIGKELKTHETATSSKIPNKKKGRPRKPHNQRVDVKVCSEQDDFQDLVTVKIEPPPSPLKEEQHDASFFEGEQLLSTEFILPNSLNDTDTIVCDPNEITGITFDQIPVKPSAEELLDFEWGEEISPAEDSDYCPSSVENNEEDSRESTEVYKASKESKPKSPKKKRLKISRRSHKSKTESKEPNGKKRRRPNKVSSEDRNGNPKKEASVVFGPKRAPFWKQRQCQYCQKMFDSKEDKLQHVESEHPGKQKYSCRICGERFTKPTNVDKHHKRFHVTERPFKCDLCDKPFSSPELMKEHRHKHFVDKSPVQCGQCQGWYKGKLCLRNHVRYAHTPIPNTGRRYKKSPDVACEICNKTYKNQEDLRYHMSKVHLKKHTKVVCEECGKELSDPRSLKKHKASQHRQAYRFQCELCNTKCLYKSHLEAHMRSAHRRPEDKLKKTETVTNTDKKGRNHESVETAPSESIVQEFSAPETQPLESSTLPYPMDFSNVTL